MTLSIILINYHSAQLLVNCLDTVYEDAAIINFEILIVDNSAGDGAMQQLTSKYEDIRWITLPGNEGFARANNAGIKASKGDVVLLLNPDTIAQDSAIRKCYERLLSSDFAAAGVQLLNADGSPQISGNFVPSGGVNLLMQVPYFGQLLKWIAKRAGARPTNLPRAVQTVTEVDWINGAFMMVKKSAIEQAGLMDEDFFLYHEESEWCSRLKKTGKLCIYGDLHVVHLEGQSANKAFGSVTAGYSSLADKKGYQLMLSMFVRIRKEFGLAWYLTHHLLYTFSLPFVLLIACLRALAEGHSSSLKFAVGYAKNVIKCWGFAANIVSGMPYFYKVL